MINYLTDLEQWQACSHADLADRTPEELFGTAFAERYRHLHDNLWSRISRVHGTLHTLEQLKQFPFSCVYGPNEMEFWLLVIQNFFDMAGLMLHGLTADQGSKRAPQGAIKKEVLTLRTLKNQILKGPWLDPKMHDAFKQTLAGRKFDEEVTSIEKHVCEIRHYQIGHHLFERDSGCLTKQSAGVSLVELWKYFRATHSLFGALSFGAAYVTLWGDLLPNSGGGEPHRNCLDKILDDVARSSQFVNQPEHFEQCWPDLRKGKSAEELRVLNELRKGVGLPEA